MSFDPAAIVEFVVIHKWWFIAIIPFGIAIMVIKARG